MTLGSGINKIINGAPVDENYSPSLGKSATNRDTQLTTSAVCQVDARNTSALPDVVDSRR